MIQPFSGRLTVTAPPEKISKLGLDTQAWFDATVPGLCLAFISESLGDIYYVSSGVLSASIAVPLFFVFWKRTTQPAVIVAALAGFLGTVGGYWYEFKFLNGTDPNAPTYYLKALPAWLQGSYGYNYLAFGVLLALVAIIAVSLATKQAADSKLRFVKDKPVDEIEAFKKACFH